MTTVFHEDKKKHVKIRHAEVQGKSDHDDTIK